MELKEKKVLVIGMGRAGTAAAKLLEDREARVTITDRREKEELRETYKELEGRGIRIETGGHPLELLEGRELIVTSPGVSSNIPLLERAKEKRIPIIGELELASSFLKVPIVAVTGTNGKTTTTTLIGKILKKEGKRVAVAGNIGHPLSSCVSEDYELVVSEVSSFQLERIKTFRPFITVLLNIAPDHLDRYRDLDEYMGAKKRIFLNQGRSDFAVLNRDDPNCRTLSTEAKKIFFSREELEEGVYLKEEIIMANLSGRSQEVIHREAIGIKGLHNLENALAAIATCLILKVKVTSIRRVLKEFKGISHRMEFIGEIKGVRFVNDSKATNVSSVMKSLVSFKKPIILIAGGKDKGLDYSPLRPLVEKKVKALILLGEAKKKIAQALSSCKRIKMAEDMKEAVNIAFGLAGEGEIVLLSPACSSYDMFQNFEERGKAFKKVVR
ncbi:UDP-N-acetylmuramoyl-L-alanine--D-glutamate ligase, partial [bacterium]|nr:UDP-N-acetylmuramoyl-L-alanine--D-glutamate ligase [bacterium]